MAELSNCTSLTMNAWTFCKNVAQIIRVLPSLWPPLAEHWRRGRENKKAEVLSERRRVRAPPVVALLPLSRAVDARQLWNLILESFVQPVSSMKPGKGAAMEEDSPPGEACYQSHIMLAIGTP